MKKRTIMSVGQVSVSIGLWENDNLSVWKNAQNEKRPNDQIGQYRSMKKRPFWKTTIFSTICQYEKTPRMKNGQIFRYRSVSVYEFCLYQKSVILKNVSMEKRPNRSGIGYGEKTPQKDWSNFSGFQKFW